MVGDRDRDRDPDRNTNRERMSEYASETNDKSNILNRNKYEIRQGFYVP